MEIAPAFVMVVVGLAVVFGVGRWLYRWWYHREFRSGMRNRNWKAERALRRTRERARKYERGKWRNVMYW